MAVALGSKPLVTPGVYRASRKLAGDIDHKNIPKFIEEYEDKEPHLAEQMVQQTIYLARAFASRVRKEHNIRLTREEVDSLALDHYINGWFHYMLLDKARDSQFELDMDEHWRKRYDPEEH